MKLNPAILILALTATVLSACGSRPSGVLSEKEIEDVLFDLHLAEAEVEDNYVIFGNDSAKKQELLEAVFKKHKITEQEFDTSLVWYSGNLNKYFKIYENLGKRYATLVDTLHAEQVRSAAALSDQGLINLWKGETCFVLRSAAHLENIFTFRLDSAEFNEGDAYELRFNILGIRDSIQPAVTFCAQRSDTTFIARGNATQNGIYTTTLSSFGNTKTEALSGSIRIPQRYKGFCIVISNFAVYQRKSPLLQKDQKEER